MKLFIVNRSTVPQSGSIHVFQENSCEAKIYTKTMRSKVSSSGFDG